CGGQSLLAFLTLPPTTDIYTLPYTTLFRSGVADSQGRVVDGRRHRSLPASRSGSKGRASSQRRRAANFDPPAVFRLDRLAAEPQDRKSTRLNSSHLVISYAVFCLKKKNNNK